MHVIRYMLFSIIIMPKLHRRNSTRQPRRRKNNRGIAADPLRLATFRNRESLASHQLLPRRIESWATTTICGYVPSNTAQNGVFNVNATSLYEPFNTTSKLFTTGGNFTLTTSYNIADNPMGYTELASIYDFYRVLESQIRVTLVPNVNGDTLALAIYPNPVGQTGANMAEASEQPYGKSKLCNPGAANSANTLTLKMLSHHVLGLTKPQFMDLQASTFGAGPSANQSWFWNVTWQCIDNANNSNPLYCEVQLLQRVEITQQLFLSS